MLRKHIHAYCVLHLDMRETHFDTIYMLYCVCYSLKLAIVWSVQSYLQLVDFLNCRLSMFLAPLCSPLSPKLHFMQESAVYWKHPHHQFADYTTVIGLINSSYEPPRRNKLEKKVTLKVISGVCELLQTSRKESLRVFTLATSSSREFKGRTGRTLKGEFTKRCSISSQQPASY